MSRSWRDPEVGSVQNKNAENVTERFPLPARMTSSFRTPAVNSTSPSLVT